MINEVKVGRRYFLAHNDNEFADVVATGDENTPVFFECLSPSWFIERGWLITDITDEDMDT